MRYVRVLSILLTVLTGCSSLGPPQTPQVPVVNVYHGVEIVDPYQWLEDWDDEHVRAWSNEQNAYARRVLDHLPYV